MVTRYRAKATKAISVFSPFWHILLTKQDLRKKSGRESKTEQPQFKSGSPLTSLEVRGGNNREEHDIILEFKIWMKLITWLESGQQLLSVGGNGSQQKISSSCCVCWKGKSHSNMNIKRNQSIF